ncbi:hypothetical protein DM02DRAFT_686517 [Periconia macrospinosa]|uniref:Uncharacterized protein n=1 Tax=Periconia macrospinosa TaxID=97972 RepID=A0A2V1DG16_9PLEO|nr:hypothetical protein DM02DRAFT_686517 [Periconia macrospinosa]
MTNQTVPSSSDAPKTCWQARSDEEIAKHLDRRNLKYRHGWPRLPPFPLNTIRRGAHAHLGENEQFHHELDDAVREICNARQIEATDIFFAWRVPQVKDPEKSYFTLVIQANLRSEPVLDDAIIQIRKYLQERKSTEAVTIEIIDSRILNNVYSFPIKCRADEWVYDNEHITFQVAVDEVEKQGENWLLLQSSRRGLENDRELCTPMLVITSKTADRDIWADAIIPNIERELASRELPLKVEVLAWDGPVFRFC